MRPVLARLRAWLQPAKAAQARPDHAATSAPDPEAAARAQGLPNSNTYWALPGVLMAGEYPGCDAKAAARERLRCYLDCGVRLFIDLTEEGELTPYAPLLAGVAAEMGLEAQHRRYPMPDEGLPASQQQLLAVLETIATARSQAMSVYVHCHGGTGRTGLVVACWMINEGLSPQEALVQLDTLWRAMSSSKRKKRTPSTDAQHAWIRNWPDAGSQTSAGN